MSGSGIPTAESQTGSYVSLADAPVPTFVEGHRASVAVPAGEQRCARGAALRGRGDVVREARPGSPEVRLRLRHHPPSELAVGLIVGMDQDDVRLARLRCVPRPGHPSGGSGDESEPKAARSAALLSATRPRPRSGSEQAQARHHSGKRPFTRWSPPWRRRRKSRSWARRLDSCACSTACAGVSARSLSSYGSLPESAPARWRARSARWPARRSSCTPCRRGHRGGAPGRHRSRPWLEDWFSSNSSPRSRANRLVRT